jgi:ABC-type molybdate transport system substrate-binding protein
MRFIVAGALLMISTLAQAETVSLFAAGSLKAALTEAAKAFEKDGSGKVQVQATFGPSGLLRERIEKGEPAHVFASADTSHPKRLADQGRSMGPVRIFARNQLCALARSDLAVSSERLLDVMLDAQVRLGTSTPRPTRRATMPLRSSPRLRSSRQGRRRHWRAGRCSSPAGPRPRRHLPIATSMPG